MKQLPKSIKVGAFTYKVQYSDTLSEEGSLGRIQLLHGVIDLRPNMSVDLERITLLHEAMHAFLFHAGVKEHDEQHLDVLSHGLVQLVRDNPKLVK